MGRLVRIPNVRRLGAGAAGPDERSPAVTITPERPQTNDSYLDRIAKYIPGEVLSFFVVLNAILTQVVNTSGKGALMAGIPVMTVALAVLFTCMVLVPLFVWYVHEEGDAWKTNAAVSTIAFPFWAYALGATAFMDYWDGNLAAILLAIFTVVSGLISPRLDQSLAVRTRTDQPAGQEMASAAAVPPRQQRPQLDLVGL